MQKWLFYDLLLSAAPALLIPLAFWLIRKPRSLEILGDGQLFFFCTAIAATTYGTLAETIEKLSRSQRELVHTCDTALLFLIVFASFAFGTATLADAGAKRRIAETSVWLSVGTAILVGSIRFRFNAW